MNTIEFLQSSKIHFGEIVLKFVKSMEIDVIDFPFLDFDWGHLKETIGVVGFDWIKYKVQNFTFNIELDK